MCHFELLRSLGDTTKHPEIRWRHRVLAHWFSQAGLEHPNIRTRMTAEMDMLPFNFIVSSSPFRPSAVRCCTRL